MTRRYTESHEWIDVNQKIGTVGISSYAQKELGEVVFIQLPEVGQQVQKGREAAVIESTKAAADIYAPISGKITAVNPEALSLINQDPEKKGWLFQIEIEQTAELGQLMDRERYLQQIAN